MTLLEKLEAATEGSRELDAMVIAHFCPEAMINRYPTPEDGIYVFHADSVVGKNKAPLPHLTTSIDAALALVDRVLPKWNISNLCQNDDRTWFVEFRRGYRISYDKVIMANKIKTLPLAIMIALIKAEESE